MLAGERQSSLIFEAVGPARTAYKEADLRVAGREGFWRQAVFAALGDDKVEGWSVLRARGAVNSRA